MMASSSPWRCFSLGTSKKPPEMREFLRRGRKVRLYVFEHADTIQEDVANATAQTWLCFGPLVNASMSRHRLRRSSRWWK